MRTFRNSVLAAVFAAALGPAIAVELPQGFRVTAAFSNLTEPTAVRFASDGRVFVAEKSGLIKVFDNLDDGTASVFADLRTEVHNFWDRGLLGLELHPGFPATPFVYVLYTHDAAIGGTAPRWGSANATSDGCPDPPGAQGHGCVVSGRLSRLRAEGNRAGEEQVLIQNWCQQFPIHSIADLAFDAAGRLYVSGGDGASANFVDYAQRGIPPNPCGDSPLEVGGDQQPPSSLGGALRSQSLVANVGGVPYNGKILRIDDAGGAAAGNPLSESQAQGISRVVARGLREPFRIAVRPGTNELWIGDVGWSTWEEINRLVDPGGAVENFGWPCFEGRDPQPAYAASDFTACAPLYANSNAVQAPYFVYRHDDPVVEGEPCDPGTSSITGLAFYNGSSFPNEYDGALFFADVSRSCIWAMLAGSDGLPDPHRRINFASDAVGVVDLVVGPGGDLFYVDLLGGAIRRISSTSQNQPPQARATAQPTSGAVPLLVVFDASGSSDADGPPPLSFSWDLDGDGTFGDASGARVQHTYTTAARYDVAVRVSDGRGATATAGIAITAGNNQPPTAVIDAPSSETSWSVGDEIAFSGRGVDPESGQLAAARSTWRLIIHHCPDNCHVHTIQTFEGVANGTFVAPDHEYPSHLELELTVVDPSGQSDTASVLVQPDTTALTLESAPPGIELSLGSESESAPFTRTVIVGSQNGVAAADSQSGACVLHRFVSWSDGGSRSHLVTAAAAPTTLVATFETVSTCTSGCPGDCDENLSISIDELIDLVNIALGRASLESCREADSDGDGSVTITDLIRAVQAALDGCSQPSGGAE